MAEEFYLSIFTPSRKLVEAEVTEVILPCCDGECGVLAGHQNFVGLLGTGAMKMVKEGNDYWFMVSSGVFEVKNGVVTVLTEVGETPDEVNTEEANKRSEELEPKLTEHSTYSDEHSKLLIEFQKEKARVEVHRRTELMN